jgi:hypothetical protein
MAPRSLPISHDAQIEAVVSAAEDLEARARAGAKELSEDGAQPHLIAALTSFELAMQGVRARLLAGAAHHDPEEQQVLTV